MEFSRVLFRSTEPHSKGCGADVGSVARGQGLVVELRTEIAGVNIRGHGARVAFGLQIAPNEIVETDALRSRQFDHSVDWRPDGDFGDESGDIVGGNGLDVGRGHTDRSIVRRGNRDPVKEIDKLSG